MITADLFLKTVVKPDVPVLHEGKWIRGAAVEVRTREGRVLFGARGKNPLVAIKRLDALLKAMEDDRRELLSAVHPPDDDGQHPGAVAGSVGEPLREEAARDTQGA